MNLMNIFMCNLLNVYFIAYICTCKSIIWHADNITHV